ncbi:MAG TPA: hypothetical protein VNN07_04375 [Candidatus Tectomicrobia bacterium]|nr:hypothetical protein [Candidatus Tectomicrobia bacterium]
MESGDVLAIVVALIVVAVIVHRANRRRTERLRESGVVPAAGRGTDADVERLVRLGLRIDAIKLYREIHGTDLKAAKQAVDAIARRSPR